MPKKIDLTGQVFGRLTVIGEEYPRKTKNLRWLCQCECGNYKAVRGYDLKSGKTQSCGCLRNERVREAIGNQLIGERFGKLVVLEQVDSIREPSGTLRTAWLCQCDCGNKVIVKTLNLKSGDTSSCGCNKSKGENLLENILKENNINYSKEYVFKDLISSNGGYLRFDFAIFKNNKLYCLIEINGIQHYQAVELFGGEERFKRQQENDQRKADYCKKNDIPLIIFSYKELDNLNFNYVKEKIYETL